MESLHRPTGFTLIEMLVVTAIIIVITAVVFAGQSSFNSTVILNNTAYDIALTARGAETYGLGTRATGITTNAGYGLDFKKSSPTSYIFFADTAPLPTSLSIYLCHSIPTTMISGNSVSMPSAPNAYPGDCVYNGLGGTDTTVMNYKLGNSITINKFCGYDLTWRCSTDATPITQLDIVYLRPNSQPFMTVNGTYSNMPPITAACVSVASPKGTYRYVYFSSVGQVDANATSCP